MIEGNDMRNPGNTLRIAEATIRATFQRLSEYLTTPSAKTSVGAVTGSIRNVSMGSSTAIPIPCPYGEAP